MAVKLQRPSERAQARYQRPKTPRWLKLLIAGAACAVAGISRTFFLPVGILLLGLGVLDYRQERKRGTEPAGRTNDAP